MASAEEITKYVSFSVDLLKGLVDGVSAAVKAFSVGDVDEGIQILYTTLREGDVKISANHQRREQLYADHVKDAVQRFGQAHAEISAAADHPDMPSHVAEMLRGLAASIKEPANVSPPIATDSHE